MTDATGQMIPVKYVKPYDRKRDAIARRILKRWLVGRAVIERVYAETVKDIEELEQAATTERTGGRKLGVKGNFQATSFDGLIVVSRSAKYSLHFDERLRAAQAIIEGIVREKTDGVDLDLVELIRGVFKPTSDGMLSQARVLGLFKLNIKHARWQEAMSLIRESIAAKRSKDILAVRFKNDRNADWQSVLLDIADGAPAVADATEAVGVKAEG
jgi:hypothetical protein